MEKFFLCMFFIFQELYIIDEEDIDVAIPLSEAFRIFILDRLDELIGKVFAGNAAQTHVREIFPDFITDGVH